MSIPTLCQLDGVSTVGACRLCLVEMDGSPKLHACLRYPGRRGDGGPHRHGSACANTAGMILELLLAERNHVCSVCVANGHCELQDLAAAARHRSRRYEYQYPAACRGCSATTASAWITTAASFARAASASVTRLRARTPGTWRAAARSRGSSPT